MPAAEYHADSYPVSLSSSVIHELLTHSPWHAWLAHPRLNPGFKPEEPDRFDLGTAAHQILLEGVDTIMECPFDSWRSADAKHAKQLARDRGKIPMLPEQAKRTRDLVKQARVQIGRSRFGSIWEEGDPEVTLHWDYRGAKCRARLDKLCERGALVLDYKTTDASAQPDAWMRGQLFSLGYDIQAAWYLLGAGLEKWSNFVFCVQETHSGGMSFIGIGPEAMEHALRKIKLAVSVWDACLTANKWPAYPDQVCWADAMPWHAARIEALEFWADDLVQQVENVSRS